MKSAIYIEEGVTQVALTPENEWEKNALKMIATSKDAKTFWGEFYECQGGWFRHGKIGEPSLMFRLEKKLDIPSETFNAETFA